MHRVGEGKQFRFIIVASLLDQRVADDTGVQLFFDDQLPTLWHRGATHVVFAQVPAVRVTRRLEGSNDGQLVRIVKLQGGNSWSLTPRARARPVYSHGDILARTHTFFHLAHVPRAPSFPEHLLCVTSIVMSNSSRVRNDPRGRGLRGILLPDLPRYKTRSEQFDAAVLDAYERILERFEPELSTLDIAVDMVPRMRLQTGYTQWPEDVVADGQVPLGRLVPAGVDHDGAPTRPRLILFRRPIEMRSEIKQERAELLSAILTRLVAYYLNLLPEQVDPRFSWDD